MPGEVPLAGERTKREDTRMGVSSVVAGPALLAPFFVQDLQTGGCNGCYDT